ncbi:MAG: type II toxin-antitoxin system HicA family toxin, partial [Chloroflexi bacterium]|nr:type II toxin-antitoxin system HicA family toxin [Chloroflexota bacterium]
ALRSVVSPKLPRITAAEALRALQRDGWTISRQSGSHVLLENMAKPGLVVLPMHQGRTLRLGTLAGILAQAGLDAEAFRRLL